jgi:Zn-dependent protease with chaperone function
MAKARQVKRNALSLEEQRLLHVVEEMAIASGVTVPSVWVLDQEEGINAFAADYSPNQAVIVVTRGTPVQLNREELQGVIGHEFGHVLNGDMRLNVQLIGILASIVVVGEAGLLIIHLGASADDAAIAIVPFGALNAAIGYIGVFFGRMIKAAVSRQREFLADASSVQFTRNPDGLISALKKWPL